MQDKLLKVLKIKIDAINTNIENLNYLNGELERNNNDLSYIENMISLFKDNNVLNFENISKNDFDKILLMIDPGVSEVFKDKTCSYDGIIYIIQGIRQSISLQLTDEQTNAIIKFVEGMKEKSLNLQDVLNNLFDSKNRLPETDLTILQNNLENYQNIVSKCENNLYLTEIDDISESLDFANVSIEEKADVFEYVLKYNANIYNSIKEEEKEDIKVEEKEDVNFDLPTFNYEDVDLHQPLETEVKVDEEKETTDFNSLPIEDKEKTTELDLNNIKFNLDNIVYNNIDDKETEQDAVIPIENNVVDAPIEQPIELPNVDSNSTLIEPANAFNSQDETKVDEDNRELSTIELEDIIQKIDAKLKEMELNEENEIKENNNIIEENVINNINWEEVLAPYALPLLDIKNSNVDDVTKMLSILNENKMLEELKNNQELLINILNNSSSSNLESLLTTVKEYLVVKDEFDYVINILLKTMPILLTNANALDSFRNNIVFFKEKNINIINLFDNYRELLIINNDILKENYNKILGYGIEVNNDNVKYLLYNRNVLKNLDYYIEAIGYEKGFLGRGDNFDGVEYIKKNPYKLNNISRDTLMKLRYSSENDMKIYGSKPGILSGEISNPKVDTLKLDSNYVNTFFNSEYGFIDRSELEKIKLEIDNLSTFDMTLDGNINKLDNNYKQNELKYKIGDIIISRIKTIRIYNFLKSRLSLHDALLIALTYNSVLKLDEYNNIDSIVTNIVNGGN